MSENQTVKRGASPLTRSISRFENASAAHWIRDETSCHDPLARGSRLGSLRGGAVGPQLLVRQVKDLDLAAGDFRLVLRDEFLDVVGNLG